MGNVQQNIHFRFILEKIFKDVITKAEFGNNPHLPFLTTLIILWMRKLRLKDILSISHGHTVEKLKLEPNL